jgi:hypothetical protein
MHCRSRDATGKIYVETINSTVTTYAADGTLRGCRHGRFKIYVTSPGSTQDSGTLTTYTANGRQTTPTITGLHYPKPDRDNLQR